MNEIPSSISVSTKLQRIAKLAKEAPEMAFTSLSHHIDVEFLKEAYRRTRKDGAEGVDGRTAAEYEQGLEERLQSLLNRFKSGTYKAPPVRRVYIPKAGTNKTRPIGIPTFEDKVLQRAVLLILEAIYEQDFSDCSYGFRRGRSAHQALERLWKATMDIKGGWVYEADIRDFFGTLRHDHLRGFLDQRVRDGVIRRTIDKWLKAGVMEEGCVTHPETGSPQGGVISPILACLYMHKVLVEWFEREVKPRLKGRAELIVYADDFVIIFELEHDARRVEEVLPKRFEKYGLTLHPEKTRLVDFRKPPSKPQGGGNGGEGKFDFLGFLHYWSKSRKGRWWVTRKTSKSRFKRAITTITEWCRSNRHDKVKEQRRKLTQKLRGHYAYYGITGNYRALCRFERRVRAVWFKWLNRRGQQRSLTGEQFDQYLQRYPLPKPRVVHSTL